MTYQEMCNRLNDLNDAIDEDVIKMTSEQFEKVAKEIETLRKQIMQHDEIPF